MTKSLYQVVSYGLIGILNTGIHFVVFWFVLKICLYQSLANLMGFLVAVTFSFVMNAKYTFKARPTRMRFLKMVVLMALVSLVFGAIGDYFRMNPLLTFGVYFVLNPLIGFCVTKFLVFGGKSAKN